MVVLDELRFPGKKPLLDVMGGSASYGTLGVRLFAVNDGPDRPTSIGCLVLAGKDFSEVVRLSTRGLLKYEDTTFGPKKFKYTTEPLKPSPSDLVSTPLLTSRTYHFLATPEDLARQVSEQLQLRIGNGVELKPLLVWEPFPPACQAQNLDSILAALDFQPEVLESCAQTFLDHSIGPQGDGCIVIRASEHGSLSASRAAGFIWSPAFYPPDLDTSRIVDPTGAGNAYIGGFAMGLQHNLTLEKAAAYGNVAASFALEQIGLPELKVQDPVETGNEVKVLDRLEEYNSRLTSLEIRLDT
ncbi:pfkB family kinase [Cadophora sp. MPI-SDFR-AT-0126]|nr:pfkB family kinase [Leotiomycetes sp. MPI-SDFR-AT-0126]